MYIVDRFKVALHILKRCGTEAQRKEYALLLRAVASPLAKRGDKSGMGTKVAKRLEVPYGYREQKHAKQLVPYAFAPLLCRGAPISR